MVLNQKVLSEDQLDLVEEYGLRVTREQSNWRIFAAQDGCLMMEEEDLLSEEEVPFILLLADAQ